MTVLISILLGIAGSLIAAEILEWCPWLTERLLHAASKRLPPRHSERYYAEWTADLDLLRRRGRLSVLIWAITVYLSAGRTAAALHPRPLRATKRFTVPHFPAFPGRAGLPVFFQEIFADVRTYKRGAANRSEFVALTIFALLWFPMQASIWVTRFFVKRTK